jgi:hypothetical protein
MEGDVYYIYGNIMSKLIPYYSRKLNTLNAYFSLVRVERESCMKTILLYTVKEVVTAEQNGKFCYHFIC